MSFKLSEVLKSKPEMLDRRDRCVSDKEVFYSKDAARRSLSVVNRRNTHPMKPYRCPFCGFFHVTHKRGHGGF